MATTSYEVKGKVIQVRSGTGIKNLRIKAWEIDENGDRLLGEATSNAVGDFLICFDSTYFKDKDPDVYFKVFIGKRLLENTRETPILNIKQPIFTAPAIAINLSTLPTGGQDLISPQRAIAISNFFQQSDFIGVLAQAQLQNNTQFEFINNLIPNAIREFDFEPIFPSSIEQKDILRTNTATVRQKLEKANMKVNVLPYNPKLDAASFNAIRVLPKRIKTGQQINLYEQDGKVMYYTVSKQKDRQAVALENVKTDLEKTKIQATEKDKIVTTLQQKINDLQNTQKEANKNQAVEFKNMKADLENTKQLVAKRDEQILGLKQQIEEFKNSQDKITSILESDKFERLLASMGTGNRPKETTIKSKTYKTNTDK